MKRLSLVSLLTGLSLLAFAVAGEAVEFSARYSQLMAVGYGSGGGGWQLTGATARPEGGWGAAFDVGGTSGLTSVMAGPRLTGRARGSVTPFAQILAGVALSGGELVFFAHPSVGVDVGKGPMAFRAQADWPLVVGSWVTAGLVRVSAGVVFR
jgi:hypothetical protein